MIAPALAVLGAGAVTAAATGLGALPLAGRRVPGPRGAALAAAAAAGVMLAAALSLALEAWGLSPVRLAAGAVAGVVAMAAIGWLVGDGGETQLPGLAGSRARAPVLIVLVMTAHSFAEGIGVGVAFGDGDGYGWFVAAAIAVHNIPEGLAISLVLVPAGASVSAAAGWSVVSSLPQALMAVPAFLFVSAFSWALPAGFGFAAGAMAWLVASELIPGSLRAAPARPVSIAAVAGFAATAALGALLLL